MKVNKTNNIKDYKKLIDAAANTALKNVGVYAKGACQANCVVKTGNLRRAHSFKITKNKVTIGINSLAPYGVYVEMKPPARGGRPWLRNTLRNEMGTIKGIIEKEFARIK